MARNSTYIRGCIFHSDAKQQIITLKEIMSKNEETHEFKETYDDKKMTIEYRDLKAETEHNESNSIDAVARNTYSHIWKISANGDKIGTDKGSTSTIKSSLRKRHSEGLKKMARK